MRIIQVFAKPPQPGKVKTRLIADLGAGIATDIYSFCLSYTLKLVQASSYAYQLWLSEQSSSEIFQTEDYHLQSGDNLGARMYNALASQLQTSIDAKVVLIGSDCLDMRQDHFKKVFAALDNYDIVLLPAVDGGFALIGCKRIDTRLFAEVEWGGSQVLQQTLANAKLLDFSVFQLETVRDVDTLDDLKHYPELLNIIYAAHN